MDSFNEISHVTGFIPEVEIGGEGKSATTTRHDDCCASVATFEEGRRGGCVKGEREGVSECARFGSDGLSTSPDG